MNRADIIRELENRGHQVTIKDNLKNGVVFEGIVIMNNSPIATVIYTEKLIADAVALGKSVADVTDIILEIYEAHKNQDFDVQAFTDADWILEHIYVAIQRTSDEPLIKKSSELEGLELYLYLKDAISDGSFSIKLTQEHLSNANIELSAAWDKAVANTCADTVILSMSEIMAEMLGAPAEEMDIPLWIISNTRRIKGASAIINRTALSQFASEFGTDILVVIPSSTHEMIILPFKDDMDIDYFSNMVKEVNDSEVAPEERLTDRAYLLKV